MVSLILEDLGKVGTAHNTGIFIGIPGTRPQRPTARGSGLLVILSKPEGRAKDLLDRAA
jgi:hypothetical protein